MRELDRKLKKAAELGATNSEIEEIGEKCKKEAKKSPPRHRKEEFTGCVIDEVDELNKELE